MNAPDDKDNGKAGQPTTTRNGRSEFIGLRVPHELLPHMQDFTETTGKSRSWLLLEGARILLRQAGILDG